MDDVQDQTPRQLQREARKRATIKAGRNAGMLKAEAHNFMLALIREIKRLRDRADHSDEGGEGAAGPE